MDGFNTSMEIIEDRSIELEDKLIEFTQSE